MEYYFEKLGTFDNTKPLVLIDFDHTISDFTKLKRAIKENCNGLGISVVDWDQSYLDVTSDLHVVKMDDQIKLLSKKYNIEESKVHDAFYREIDESSKYLFDDVIPFLEKYSKSCNFVLFTLGAEKFQMSKRKSSNIDKYLRGSIYTLIEKDYWMFNQLEETNDNKLMVKSFDMSFPLIYVIDDRPSSFDKFKNTFNKKLVLIRLKRIDGRYSMEDDILKTNLVTNLSEIVIQD